jgi:hypothetical protein
MIISVQVKKLHVGENFIVIIFIYFFFSLNYLKSSHLKIIYKKTQKRKNNFFFSMCMFYSQCFTRVYYLYFTVFNKDGRV